jgi:glutathione synthase/RimK-type ligase-like ATP-grasp enzyme/gamma-glutamyl:cysteine ligase YbdK (ATP-grasp superfamily)
VAAKVHRRFPVPALRLSFVRLDGSLRLFHLEPVPLSRLGAEQRERLVRAIEENKLAMEATAAPATSGRASLAVLYDPTDPFKPSYDETLARLERVAERQELRIQRIGLNDLARVSEHDALFIRTLTGPDLPAFRFAQRAEALGLPVIDSTHSILRCGNKVYLAELLERAGVPTPRTAIVVMGTTYEQVVQQVGSPFVLKVPDGSFSTAVFRIPSREAWDRAAQDLLSGSPLLIAQAWMPSDFDWRIGVLDGRPIFACRYWMVAGHWQIRRAGASGSASYGRTEGVPLEGVSAAVKRAASRAAKLIGDGLYGVDVKEINGAAVVIEVNDNPDLHVGYEDQAEGDRVYEELVSWFVKRIEREPPGRRLSELPPATAAPSQPPIGRTRREPQREYRAYEVVGLEVEYAIVSPTLEPLHAAEGVLAELGGRPTSEVDLGVVAFSNEFFDHLIELKTQLPLSSLVESEQVLAEGVSRLADKLEERFDARPMPTSMHPWFDPKSAVRWSRSGRTVYDTYARLFDTSTHGWANVQSLQVNLPLGREHEAVAMMNASALLVPYLPAVAASSPMYDGALQPAVDNRLAFILEHQLRVPQTQGELVPEYMESLAGYKRDILRPIYQAVDALEDARAIRHEWLNARGAVFKLSRRSIEVRVIDSQECTRMDVAIAAFVRGALHDMSADLVRGRLTLPMHSRLVEDLHACVRAGSLARVWATHVPGLERDDDGKAAVSDVIDHFLVRAARRLKKQEQGYLELIDGIRRHGTLSERMALRLAPHRQDPVALRETTRELYLELCDCLAANKPWSGARAGAPLAFGERLARAGVAVAARARAALAGPASWGRPVGRAPGGGHADCEARLTHAERRCKRDRQLQGHLAAPLERPADRSAPPAADLVRGRDARS